MSNVFDQIGNLHSSAMVRLVGLDYHGKGIPVSRCQERFRHSLNLFDVLLDAYGIKFKDQIKPFLNCY